MKTSLFEYPSYQYQIDDWSFKKKGILNRINSQKFIRTILQTFETDRQTNRKSYLHYFQDLIRPQLFEFCQEVQVTCSMTDCWAEYRQALRDLPETYPNSEDIVWPSKPEPIIVFVEPEPTPEPEVTEEPVITFNEIPEPVVTEEPVVEFDTSSVSSGSSETTIFTNDTITFSNTTTSSFGTDTTIDFGISSGFNTTSSFGTDTTSAFS